MCAFLVVVLSTSAKADILTVANLNNSGPGSLRDTLAAAASGDTIVFDRNLNGGTLLLGGTELTIDKDITIDASSLLNGLTIDGNAGSRIFDVTGNFDVILSDLTLQNGFPLSGSGGVIRAFGTLRIVNCHLVNNAAAEGSGAIHKRSGELFIINSTIAGNRGNNVAGIFASRCNATIIGSTFSGNSGISGPTGFSDSIRFESDGTHHLFMTNSTISGNSASGRSGGLVIAGFNSGTVSAEIHNTTITENVRGGLDIAPRNSSTVDVSLFNTIVSGNTSLGILSDITGNLNPASSNNLIGTGGGLTNGVNNNIVGQHFPMLSPLQDNGGPTLTHIPITDSPAIDVSAIGELYDQRGVQRAVGAAFDIGSVEGVDHTAARAALNTRIAGLSARIAGLQAQSDRFKKKAKKAKKKNKGKAKKFKKRARQTDGQITMARIQQSTLRNQLQALLRPGIRIALLLPVPLSTRAPCHKDLSK